MKQFGPPYDRMRRLVVCDTRAQQQHFEREYPDDYVVVAGEALYGLRVSEIIDLRNPDIAPMGSEGERYREWWDHAQCRVFPVIPRED